MTLKRTKILFFGFKADEPLKRVRSDRFCLPGFAGNWMKELDRIISLIQWCFVVPTLSQSRSIRSDIEMYLELAVSFVPVNIHLMLFCDEWKLKWQQLKSFWRNRQIASFANEWFKRATICQTNEWSLTEPDVWQALYSIYLDGISSLTLGNTWKCIGSIWNVKQMLFRTYTFHIKVNALNLHITTTTSQVTTPKDAIEYQPYRLLSISASEPTETNVS